jgi:tricorn protease
MKNRFYDAKMHGADWNGAWKTYGRCSTTSSIGEELHTVMMMMIGQLKRVAYRRQRRPATHRERTSRRAIRASIWCPMRPGFYKVGHIYKDGPPIATT